MWLCAAPAYLERRGAPSTRAQLTAHDAIVRLLAAPKNPGNCPQAPARRACRSALAGEGIAQLPGWFAEDEVRAERLCVVLQDAQPAPLPNHVLWSRNTRMTARQRVAIDALIEHLAPQRPCGRA
ncbi:LysR substrate-binding domain-containing protein [Comamonas antarctica]|uniref:LysR substrate-binding domain-containing protein n=1 Tax=Comamonas antarctica TaxID=2743470 RepID=UPI0033132020